VSVVVLPLATYNSYAETDYLLRSPANAKRLLRSMKQAISFAADGWEDYLYWQNQDDKTLKKINNLLKDYLRNPASGIGKPEQLKHELIGAWSRRINDEHRLVYLVADDEIQILSCRYHY
jgi:toxin YoeB